MQRIVVAAKAGADQPWVAEAAAHLAAQTGAKVNVVSARRPRRWRPSPPCRARSTPSRARESAEALVLRHPRERRRGHGRDPRGRRRARHPALRRGARRRPHRGRRHVARARGGAGARRRPARAGATVAPSRADRRPPARAVGGRGGPGFKGAGARDNPPGRPGYVPPSRGGDMAAATRGGLFATKPVDALVADTEDESAHAQARRRRCSTSPRWASARSSAPASSSSSARRSATPARRSSCRSCWPA